MDARIRFGVRSLGAAIAACALTCGPAVAATASPQAVRVGSAPVLPSGAQTVAALPAGKQLRLTIALKSQDPSGLESLAGSVATPSSPLFRHYLTVSQFAQSFGATPAQIALVQSALRAQGLTVGVAAANGLTLPVSGTAKQVQQALSISLFQIKLASGRSAYANADAPAIPASAARFVQGVVGLANVAVDQPQQATAPPHSATARRSPSKSARNLGASQILTGGPQPCAEASETEQNEEGGYTADAIASAYQFSSLYGAGDFGAGQTVALFEQQPFNPSDIAAYQQCFGTSTAVSSVNVDGGPEGPVTDDGESALDIEQIIGLAPQAHVLVYQGPEEQQVAPVDIISAIVSEDRAKVISSSWGECEALTEPTVIPAENALLQEAATQGQSFFVASGDSGSEQCAQVESSDRSLAVLNPASQPFATGVGGTWLKSRNGGSLEFYDGSRAPTEGIWNYGFHNQGGASGGGISREFAMPAYQSGASSSLGVINGDSSSAPCGQASLCREVPDVSADADPGTGYVVFDEGEWTVIGGTSASAPLWAALTSLANASATCHGVPIGFANPALYSIAGSSYPNDFHDVTEASLTHRANNNPEGTGLYPVTPGYDMTTGIGTPIGPNLAASLCSLTSPAPVEAAAQGATPSPTSSPSRSPAIATPNAVAAGPTTAQIVAQLAKLLAPAGKGATIAALLKAGGLAIAFKALSAGTVVIGWYELPKGAKLAGRTKPKPVVVASAQLKFTAPGSRTIKLRLTPAGKRLLKHAKRLALTGKGTFTPVGKPPLSTVKSFLLRR